MREQLDVAEIGLADCQAPFTGLVLLGVQQLAGDGSIWFALPFVEGKPLVSVRYFRSPNGTFPDPNMIREQQPTLIAAANAKRWRELENGDESAFLKAVREGAFELGGNFGKYRQHLEWFLANSTAIRLVGAVERLAGT